jgi:hypothetical protein
MIDALLVAIASRWPGAALELFDGASVARDGLVISGRARLLYATGPDALTVLARIVLAELPDGAEARALVEALSERRAA